MKKILLYGVDDTAADHMQNTAASAGYAMYVIGDEAMELNVEDVFDLKDDLNPRHEAFPDSYMLFQDFELNEIISLLVSFEQAGCPFDGIKVMRTEMNHGMKLRELLEAAAVEQENTKRQIVLQELVRSCSGVDLSAMEEGRQKQFSDLVKDAIRHLHDPQGRPAETERLIKELKEQLKDVKRLLN